MMRKRSYLTDLMIVEALAKYGPRNVTEVARKLGMPAETLRKRIKRLYTQSFLRFHINVNHAFLGLKKAIVFAEAVPGYEDALFEALKINDFWIFVSRCYGMFEGCVAIFVVPMESCHLFEQFIDKLQKFRLAKRTEIFWSTYFYSINSRGKWFNKDKNSWQFNWTEWIEEIKEKKVTSALLEPEPTIVNIDRIDILILKELEKDARISFRKLAERLKISPQLVRYHYYNHIISRGLLKDFDVTFFHFGKNSDFSFFIFSFDEERNLIKFAASLMDKPFVKAIGKILNANQLYAYIYLPRPQLRNFLKALSKLIQEGFLKSYQYAIQDLTNSSRATIPFQCYKNGRWEYNHQRYMKILHKFLEEKCLTFLLPKPTRNIKQKIKASS